MLYFFLFALLSTSVGLHFRPHYFILLFPALSMIGSYGVYLLLYKLQSSKQQIVYIFIVAIVIAVTIFENINYYFGSDPKNLDT